MTDEKLLELALDARKNAYVPYSGYAVGAALLAWQGGMEGGLATAELLCGKISPSGKLPDTFAASVDDYPSTADFHESVDYVDYTEDIYVGYRYFETFAKDRVRYPFGFGLSYTTFSAQHAMSEAPDHLRSLEVSPGSAR